MSQGIPENKQRTAEIERAKEEHRRLVAEWLRQQIHRQIKEIKNFSE